MMASEAWTGIEIEFNFAVRSNDIEVVNTILRDHPDMDPGAHDNIVLVMAASRGHVEIVDRLLLDHRVDPGDNSNAAIQNAVRNRHLGVVQSLLADDRVDPSANGNHAFLMAYAGGYEDIAALLLTDLRVVAIISGTTD